jgi:hypothetical protein
MIGASVSVKGFEIRYTCRPTKYRHIYLGLAEVSYKMEAGRN